MLTLAARIFLYLSRYQTTKYYIVDWKRAVLIVVEDLKIATTKNCEIIKWEKHL